MIDPQKAHFAITKLIVGIPELWYLLLFGGRTRSEVKVARECAATCKATNCGLCARFPASGGAFF